MISIYRYKIELVTYSDILKFVAVAAKTEDTVKLLDGNGLCVNGKSLLGAIATVEWDSLYCESDSDLYAEIKDFVK